MPFVTRKTLLTLSILSGVAVTAMAGFIWSGLYNVGADDQHTRPVYALMKALRERSVEVRASKLDVPDLKDQARIVQGAGNYDAMCTGCHLTPGAEATELSKGLYPSPPNLTKEAVDAGKAFWVIKHGVKASGMPAWGKSMDDEYIWNIVAFVQVLPSLNAEKYQALVDRSGGHSHGGGESGGHSHSEGTGDPDEHEGDGAEHPHPDDGTDAAHGAAATATTTQAGTTHVHADGKRHVHAPKPAEAARPPASVEQVEPPVDAKPKPAEATPAEAEHDAHDHDH